ncbi:DUF5655 domain-containing protein [Streptomyces sp. CBMA152]|uniref:DUF5655 domain-containing protein n=1 Tax=Streptomyces sp. CBMA152 TaxID=1896312 RepID=UPI002948B89A|nr:DUF5655 domain-containing protein [Streptomyces sp. CBMA152]
MPDPSAAGDGGTLHRIPRHPTLSEWTSRLTTLLELRPSCARCSPNLDEALHSLGDVQRVSMRTCLVYRALRGFAWVRVQKEALVVTLRVDPDNVELRAGFTRDLRDLGHNGGGDLEVRIRTAADVISAMELFQASFEVA